MNGDNKTSPNGDLLRFAAALAHQNGPGALRALEGLENYHRWITLVVVLPKIKEALRCGDFSLAASLFLEGAAEEEEAFASRKTDEWTGTPPP